MIVAGRCRLDGIDPAEGAGLRRRRRRRRSSRRPPTRSAGRASSGRGGRSCRPPGVRAVGRRHIATSTQRLRRDLPQSGRATDGRGGDTTLRMVSLLLGPVLRHVGERDATVWVETDGPCHRRGLRGHGRRARAHVLGRRPPLRPGRARRPDGRVQHALRGAARRLGRLAARRLALPAQPDPHGGPPRPITPRSSGPAASRRRSSGRATPWSTPTCSSRSPSG